MADNKLTQTNRRFLYETAASATPTTWAAVAEGYTWSDDGRLFRVTADEAQFDSTAYVVQRTNQSGDYEDALTVSLNVPDGHGLSRIDVFDTEVVSGTPDYTTVELSDTFQRRSQLDLLAHDQQTALEQNETGIIFEYAGAKYRGTITSRTDSKEMQPGGYLEGVEAIITTSRQQWSTAGVTPIINASVLVNGVKYRIETIEKNNAHWQLNLTKQRGH